MNANETRPPANTVYCGTRTPDGGWIVTADAQPLSTHRVAVILDLDRVDIAWGWYTPGAFRLALALLIDATRGNLVTANDLYMRYAHEVVCRWPKTGFATSRAVIMKWIADKVCPHNGTTTPNGG